MGATKGAARNTELGLDVHQFPLRVPGHVWRALAEQARQRGESVNTRMIDILGNHVGRVRGFGQLDYENGEHVPRYGADEYAS